MQLRKLHFVVGLAGVVAFLVTGAYMRAGFPDLYAANEVLRYLYRSNHVYILLASLVNVALGVHLTPRAPGWRATVSLLGSLLALASPVVLCFAFFVEAPVPTPERVLTLVGVVAVTAGIALHVLGGSAALKEGTDSLIRPRGGLTMILRSTVAGGSRRAASLSGCGGEPSADEAAALRALEARVAALEQRKERIEDVNAIERLQAAYGYYVDRALWDDVANLFADDGTIEIGLDGVYVGKQRVREYLYALGGGRQGLVDGELSEHLQVMPVITLAPDGLTAKARWRAITLTGELGGDAFWGEGPYENEYVKDDGVWKIKTLHWYQALHVPYAGGWQTNPDPTGAKFVSSHAAARSAAVRRVQDVARHVRAAVQLPEPRRQVRGGGVGGDANDTRCNRFGVAASIGIAAWLGRPAASQQTESIDALAARAAALERDIARLEDVNAIKKLQRIYGFYTDKQLWSEAADLFSADGDDRGRRPRRLRRAATAFASSCC